MRPPIDTVEVHMPEVEKRTLSAFAHSIVRGVNKVSLKEAKISLRFAVSLRETSDKCIHSWISGGIPFWRFRSG